MVDWACKHSQPSNKLYRTRIASDDCIRREKHHAFDDRLGNEDPVERILVKGREGIDFHSVHTRDWKLAVAVV